MAKIWIIGGTTETFETAEKLLKNKKDIIITVATKYGLEEFAKFSPYLLQKSMDENQMEEFCKEYNIEKIADISHPYAQNVSKNALEVSKKLNIPYFRYERQNSDISYENEDKNIFYVDSHSGAIKLAKEKNFQKILITTGINNAFEYVNANFPQLYIRSILSGCWNLVIVAPITLLKKFPYAPNSPGYGYEDWYLSCCLIELRDRKSVV